MGSQYMRVEDQWVPREDAESEDSKPASAKQLNYIEVLAREAGVKVNLDKIETSDQASKVITRLKQLSGKPEGGVDLRERRIAFGMATKLVFRKYMESHRDYRKVKSFWKEVEAFFRDYEKAQETAVSAREGGANAPSSSMHPALQTLNGNQENMRRGG